MNRETLSQLVARTLQRVIHTRRVSMASMAIRIRQAWERRYPDDTTVEWSQSRDQAHRAEMDAQRLARMMPGGNNHMPIELLPCLRDAIYEADPDIGRAFDADLASILGGVTLAPTVEGEVGPSSVADLMREAADSIKAIADMTADGRVTPQERAKSVGELEQLIGVAVGLVANLKSSAGSEGSKVRRGSSAPSGPARH